MLSEELVKHLRQRGAVRDTHGGVEHAEAEGSNGFREQRAAMQTYGTKVNTA